jgi:hypothetical protein
VKIDNDIPILIIALGVAYTIISAVLPQFGVDSLLLWGLLLLLTVYVIVRMVYESIKNASHDGKDEGDDSSNM